MFDVRESWTDERLDDFRGEVNRRFDEVYRRFDDVDRHFDKVDRQFGKAEVEFHRINDRLDGLHRILVFVLLAFTSTTIAGYGALVALIVTGT